MGPQAASGPGPQARRASESESRSKFNRDLDFYELEPELDKPRAGAPRAGPESRHVNVRDAIHFVAMSYSPAFLTCCDSSKVRTTTVM